ncbi:MAG: hypothetical protein IJ074_09050 [Clostridia bacterium]|nr:hypothetical protein [Clostridia bacterium]
MHQAALKRGLHTTLISLILIIGPLDECKKTGALSKIWETDEDDDRHSTSVSFQVAYAVSVHKAQGLEYESEKNNNE